MPLRINHGCMDMESFHLKRAFILTALIVFCSAHVSFAASSFSTQKSNAIVVSDPCPVVWDKLSDKYKKPIQVKGVSIDVKKVFMTKCGEYRDKLIEQAKQPITDAQAQAKQGLDAAVANARNMFLSWVAEKFRDKIIPTLPPDIQANYDPNSPLIQAKAQAWLKQPGQEISTYVNEYIQVHAPSIAQLIAVYSDLKAGESAQIISGMKAILQKAQDRLQRFVQAKKEIEANPETPYTEILEKYGFSGAWLDKFKQYEGQINALDAATNMKAVVFTTVEAFQTDDPKIKIEKMFDIMDAMSSAASNSQIPLVSLMGDIVNNMAQVAKKMLAEVRSLGELLKKRAAYCEGTGAPGDDMRSRILDKRGILACPLSYSTLPWRNIYETIEPQQGQLLFWDGSQFIDGRPEGGFKEGLQQTMKLMTAAKALGYSVNTGDIQSIAKVYNTPGGIPALMKEGSHVIGDIASQAQRLKQAMGTKGVCSQASIIHQVEAITGLNLQAFLNELESEGQSRLITTYAASYVAKQGGFGDVGGQRTQAYERYKAIHEKLKSVQLMIIDGSVRSQTNPQGACQKCAKAIINAKPVGAVEVRGCEVWQANDVGNFVMHLVGTQPAATVALQAVVEGAQSEKQTIHLRSGPQYVRLLVDIKDNQEAEEADKKKEEPKTKAKDLNLCDLAQLNVAKVDESLSAEQKQVVLERIQLIEKAQATLNPAITSLPQLINQIANHQQLMAQLSNCPKIHSTLTESWQRLDALHQAMKQAEKGKQACRISQVEQALNAIKPFDQPIMEPLKQTLQQRISVLETAKSVYKQADQAFRAGDPDSSLAHLQKVKQALVSIQCPTDIVDNATALVNEMAKAKSNPNAAQSSCNLSIIKTAVQAIGNKTGNEDLKIELLTRQKGMNAYHQGVTDFNQGNLDKAEQLFNEAKQKIRTSCKNYQGAIDDYLKRIAQIRTTKARIEQAIRDCDLAVLGVAKSKLAGKINPYLQSLIPQVNYALTSCDEGAARQNCVRDYGENIIIQSVNGKYTCACAPGYVLSIQTSRCVKKQSTIEEGHPQCRKIYGDGAYAIKVNEDGTFQCQCRSGYHWQDSPKRCVLTSIKDGHRQCRKEYGRGAYAVSMNADGSANCQCRGGYVWNDSRNYCRRITKADGHRMCKQQYGNNAYATQYLGNGRWNCYIPQVLQCPSGYYLLGNRCYPNIRLNPPEIPQGGCPPGYHRPPGGGECHRG